MKHTFIWNGSSWWLKISTIEEMCDYLNVEWDRRKQACLEDKERVKKKFHSSNYLTGACDVISTVKYISFNEALDGLQKQLYKNWYQFLLEGKTIFVNGVGGYNLSQEIKRAYQKEGYDFPCFSEKDIRITQWPNGIHFYAYIGDLEIKDELGNIKWNTRTEAEEQARKYVTKKAKGDRI